MASNVEVKALLRDPIQNGVLASAWRPEVTLAVPNPRVITVLPFSTTPRLTAVTPLHVRTFSTKSAMSCMVSSVRAFGVKAGEAPSMLVRRRSERIPALWREQRRGFRSILITEGYMSGALSAAPDLGQCTENLPGVNE